MSSEANVARDRLALALDVDSWGEAEQLVTRLRPWFGVAKMGLELYAGAGPDVIARLHDLGLRVFADLKLYDIPTTVERAARALGRRGVDFLNFPAVGGVAMLRAGIGGLREGAAEAGHAVPTALAVTVLTSESDAAAFPTRLDAAAASGCEGVVCSAFEVDLAHARGLRAMVPGVRFAESDRDDQMRVATPGEAAARGADWLVVGRAVTRAQEPEVAAQRLTDEVAVTRH